MQNIRVMRTVVSAVLAAATVAAAGQSAADPTPLDQCDYPACTPGIMPNVVLGAPCSNTTYYVFGSAVAGPSTLPGRLVFCGSPRRYDPRWFRSPEMHGIKAEGGKCDTYDGEVAQTPDGLFLTCVADVNNDGETLWRRGDL